MTGIDRQRQNGQTIREVEISRQQHDYDVHISTATGTIVSIHAGRPGDGER
jgi:uncharacterized membrane protein YkoI